MVVDWEVTVVKKEVMVAMADLGAGRGEMETMEAMAAAEADSVAEAEMTVALVEVEVDPGAVASVAATEAGMDRRATRICISRYDRAGSLSPDKLLVCSRNIPKNRQIHRVRWYNQNNSEILCLRQSLARTRPPLFACKARIDERWAPHTRGRCTLPV